MICPICSKEHEDDFPVEVNGVILSDGCQDCWEKQCEDAWNLFFTKIVNNQQSMPPEFTKIVDENFWELIEKEDKRDVHIKN